MPESLFNIKNKETLVQVFSCEFCEISKNRVTASDLPSSSNYTEQTFMYLLKVLLETGQTFKFV